jgi:hypothetical protein
VALDEAHKPTGLPSHLGHTRPDGQTYKC